MSAVDKVLSDLREQGLLTDLDLHFARLMCRLAGDESMELALAAALTSNATGQGHVCLELDGQSGRWLGKVCRTPDRGDWEQCLKRSPVVGEPGQFHPLILDTKGRLYLYRYWAYERQLADDLLARTRSPTVDPGQDSLTPMLERLFPGQGITGTDWQKVAAAVVVLRRFVLISGGPGTGKTSTVVRMLALLQQQAGERPLDIALAAPTGKAAARLQESIREAKQGLPVEPALLERIPEQASTLHRLLGARPDSVYFRHDRDNPLPLDVLILDEASMVDIALMSKLVQALSGRTRLILLGDRDQLSSVEAGAVLGDIGGDAPGFSEDFRRQLIAITGEEIPPGRPSPSPLADSVVLLRHSYRFDRESGIGQLSEAINQSEGERCLELLRDQRQTDIGLLDRDQDLLTRSVEGYRPFLRQVTNGASAQAIFDAFGRFRLLTPLRRGGSGTEGLNDAIERALEEAGLLNSRTGWYPGRPVMIRRNDYNLHLYNGDIGILLPDEETGDERVCFQGAGGLVRRIAPSRLPEHETAFAMTVHKSQGSEFDQVLLALPDRDSPLLSRELIYTAVTRARQGFELSDPAELLQIAVERKRHRSSGLRDALWGDGVYGGNNESVEGKSAGNERK